MIAIRTAVFETNSSSTHVLSISDNCDLYDTLPINEDGVIIIEAESYPYSDNQNYKFRSAIEKTKIVFASIGNDHLPYWELDDADKERLRIFEKVILDHTQAKSINYQFQSNRRCGFDSWAGDIGDFTETELKNFLFNLKTAEVPYL